MVYVGVAPVHSLKVLGISVYDYILHSSAALSVLSRVALKHCTMLADI